jgi:transposase
MQVVDLANGSRRRRWSVDEKAKIVAETFAPGVRVAEVAGKYSIAPNLLFAWRREVSPRDRQDAADVGSLVAVHVAASRHTSDAASMVTAEPPHRARPTEKKAGMIEIELGGGKRVRVASDFDADALGRVLDVLERR